MFSRSTVIRLSSVALAVGAVAGFALPSVLAVVGLLGLLIGSIRQKGLLAVLLTFAVGVARGWVAVPSNPLPIDTKLRAVVVDDPTVYQSVIRIPVRGSGRSVDVYARTNDRVVFGDEVSFQCQSSEQRSRFQRPRCSAQQLTVVQHQQANRVFSAIHSAKVWLEGTIRRMLPSPEAPLLAGLLLGSRDELPLELQQAFRTTGTSHIVAVSGFNVTVVVGLIATMVSLVSLPRWSKFFTTIAAVSAFVILTGASPSVVRAGIMGSLVVLARHSGRLADGLHLLVLSASLMVFVSPATIASIGFQLSVAATAGLVLLSDTVAGRLRFVPEVLGLRSNLGTTLAAIVMTQPIIALYFGQLSVVAPLVNLLVLPLIPLAMLTGFVAALVSGVVPVLAPYTAWFAWAPLKLMVLVEQWGAALPRASLNFGAAGSLVVAAVWAALAGFLLIRKQRSHATT